MLHILISHGKGNILNCHITILKERLSLFHPDIGNMLAKGLSGFVLNVWMLQYNGLYNELKRYLTIRNQLNVLPKSFSADDLMKLRLFLFEEYKYVEKYPALYSEIKERCIPSKERAQNTVAIKLRILQAFYTELEDRDEIDVSAFRKLDKNRRKVVMKESYDAPVYLLQEAKEAFLLQCTFGSHIDDFNSLNMDKVLSVPRGFLTYAICLRKH